MIVSPKLPRGGLGRAACVLMAVSLLAAVSTPVIAQLPTYEWCLRISEKEMLLANGSDPDWVAALNFDIGFNRMWHRNMPALELSNISDPGVPDIVRFEMTIGDPRFHFSDDHFGEFAPLGATTPGFNLTSSVADGGDKLIVNISKPNGSGLASGELVRFRIQIGVDPGHNFFAFPDFRTVLFDMNGVAVYGPEPNVPPNIENAQGTAIFADGREVGPATFVDEMVVPPQSQFFNGTFPQHSMLQPVDVFKIGDRFVIPEPGSALLAAVALLGGLTLTARGRRNANQIK